MPKHVGIVACSAEGAALCFKTLCEQGESLFGTYAHPEVTLHAHSFSEYVDSLEAGDWNGIAELMLASSDKLAKAGADFLICPDNTIHQAMEYVLPRSPLPWLHIAEVVAAEAQRRGFRRVGVLGTRWLVAGDVYPSKLGAAGIECVRPAGNDRDAVSAIIMDELVHGIFRATSVETVSDVIRRMAVQGCDAVALGCTELPLIITDGNCPLPCLDSTRLLAQAALRKAV